MTPPVRCCKSLWMIAQLCRLSDPFCVGRHREAFRDLVDGHVDILFANEAEICSLYEIADFAIAAANVRGHVAIAAALRNASCACGGSNR